MKGGLLQETACSLSWDFLQTHDGSGASGHDKVKKQNPWCLLISGYAYYKQLKA